MLSERMKAMLIWGTVLTIGAGIVWYFERGALPAEKTAQVGNVGVTGSGEFTVERVESEVLEPPALGILIVFAPDVPADIQTILTTNVVSLRSAVENDSLDVASWAKLGLQYKMAGDYDRARKSWEYVLVLAPSDVVTLHNLGHLYRYYLKDAAKARFYFEKALALAEQGNNPQLITTLKTELSTLQ